MEITSMELKLCIGFPILHSVTKNNPAVCHMGFSSDSANCSLCDIYIKLSWEKDGLIFDSFP